MQARMTNPLMVLPDGMKALLALSKAAQSGTVAEITHTLNHLRVSQISGCSLCVDMHARQLKKAGEKDERIWGVGAWRESPYFSNAERAALALAECVTRSRTGVTPSPMPSGMTPPTTTTRRALVTAVVNRGDQRLEPAQRRDPAASGLCLVRRREAVPAFRTRQVEPQTAWPGVRCCRRGCPAPVRRHRPWSPRRPARWRSGRTTSSSRPPAAPRPARAR